VRRSGVCQPPLRPCRATSPRVGGRERGQALIETAVTILALVFLFLGFLSIGVAAQAYVDLNTAVSLAAASAATAPAGDSADGNTFAQETFNVTVSHFSLLQPITPNEPNCGGSTWAPTGDPPQPWKVTCTGTAYLRFSQTPLAIIIPVDPRISTTASAYGSPYRSTK
jgi:hypothetical protein